MQLDRRTITNGLAWAGAALIIAIPAADLIARQFSSEPQVAVVEDASTRPAPDLPTASTERPAPATSNSAATPAAQPVAAPANATSGDAVDTYLQSGRELPSYISGGSGGASAPAPTTQSPVTPAPVQTAAVPAQQTQSVQPPATQNQQPARPVITPPRAVSGFPTPVSERPRAIAAQSPVIQPSAPAPVVQPAAPPLIIDTPAPVVTAQDLEDWETGPLSDFLANRNGRRTAPAPSTYDGNGFWLDQGPNAGRGSQFPQAYDDDYYYPFGQ
jgi:hypothetical protein